MRARLSRLNSICTVMMCNGVVRNNLTKEGRKVGNGARFYSLVASGCIEEERDT